MQTEPFAMVPEWLLFSSASDKAVRMFAVLHRHEGPGGVFPSRRRLALLMGCSIKTVDRILAELQTLEAVSIDVRVSAEGDRASNNYRLHFQGGVASPMTLPRVTHDATGGVTHDATGGVTHDALTRTPFNENPRNEMQLQFDEILMAQMSSARTAYEREGEAWIGDAEWLARQRRRKGVAG